MHTAFAFVAVATALLAAAPIQDPNGQQQPAPGQGEPRRERAQERREEREQRGEGPRAAQEVGEGESGESEQMDESQGAKPYDGPYRSPYKLTLKYPTEELLFDARGPRGAAGAESTIPEKEWYSEETRKRCGAWGIPARQFDCPPEVHAKPAEWRRERIVAGAARYIGYEYQHHHVPDWNPPQGWPWNKCCAGKQGKGVDCSNFSGWNYNWGLGIHLNTDIHKQAAMQSVHASHGEAKCRVIKRPEGNPEQWYEELCRTLQPGDLLYIMTNKMDHVSHVIMWMGSCASSPDGTPLIMDSTGGKIKDSNGHAIPCGIHLRPFAKGSWYHKSFSHAHRWVE